MDNRLADLERRVAALESAESVRRRPQEQQGLEADWASRASALAALGHPVRLTLLREILHGRTTVSALSEVDSLGTSGQIYHHLRQLTAEGWLHTPSRGVFAVPQARADALLAILAALEPWKAVE